MQSDFHFAAIYVLARWAGFLKEDAEILAYASQYVDDAVQSGIISFSNGAKFERRSSAHKMIDKDNFNEVANRQAWVVFHFLPGNRGLSAVEGAKLSFREKIVCCPESRVIRDMIAECIAEKKRPYALHRLGIALHVYADSWSHQGFVGAKDSNNVIQLEADDDADRLESESLRVWPLGHAMALSYPDHPWRSWQYRNAAGKVVRCNNTKRFISAADAIIRLMRRYIAGDAENSSGVNGLTKEQRDLLTARFRGWTSSNGTERRRAWIEGIARGEFFFPPGESICYSDEGPGSWKALALKTAAGWENPFAEYVYTEDFLTSNWKLFHDGVQAHSFFVLHELLPKYGICLA